MLCDITLSRWFVLLCRWILFLSGLINYVESITCPSVCFCPSVTQYVHCSRKNLPFIPSGISTNTTHLYLNENNFQNPNLTRSNFTHLTQVQQLFLISCGVERIAVDTFSDLGNLKWLDISKNRLKIIYDDTFRGLRLDHLFLNDNPGMYMSPNAFRGLQTTGLYIHNCAIAEVSIAHISPLNNSLKSLWLDGNKIERLDKNWKHILSSLSNVRINDNPFHCNCEIRWLFNFYLSHDTVFAGVEPPSCRTPSGMRGKHFNTLNDDDFECKLPIFKNVDLIFEQDVGKLTCLAFGDPKPTIIWVRPDKSEKVFPPKEKVDILDEDNEGVLYLQDPQFVQNAKYQCIAKNPAGNVTLNLAVVWPKPFSQQAVQDPAILETPPSTPPSLNSKRPYKPKDEVSKIKDDKKPIIINASGQSSSISQSVSSQSDTEVTFTMVDIVGAVVGTFLLTLLACVVIFHLFHRHHERFFYRNQNGVNGSCTNQTKHIVSDVRNENVKMLPNSRGMV